MLPNIASENQLVEYSPRKAIYFVAAAIVAYIGICFICQGIEHVELGLHSLLIWLCIVPFAMSIILEILVFGRTAIQSLFGNKLLFFIISSALLIIPQIITYLARITEDYRIYYRDKALNKQYKNMHKSSSTNELDKDENTLVDF